MKSLLFALLALMLGAGHGACAGMIENATPSPAYEEAVAHHHSDAQQDHAQNATGHADHQRGDHKPPPCGPGDADCQHCKAAQFYKTPAKSELAAAPALQPLEKTSPAFAETQALIVGRDSRFRIAFRWRGPPTATPVSLKIRLLT